MLRLHRFSGLVGLAAAAVLLAGCAVNGPDAESPAEPTSAPSADPGSSLSFPPRPGNLPVMGAQDTEICSWLAPEQQKQLQVSRPKPATKDGNNYNGCMFTPDGSGVGAAVGIRLVPQGLDAFAQQLNGSPETQKTIDVNGFGAVQNQVPGAEGLGCSVFVDAADGQTLYVDVTLLEPGALDSTQMCEKAAQAAGAAVTSLQAKA